MLREELLRNDQAVGVEYFLFGDRHIRELRFPRHSITTLVVHGAAVHAMHCLIIAFIPAVNSTKISGPCRCYYVGAELYVVVYPWLRSIQNAQLCS